MTCLQCPKEAKIKGLCPACYHRERRRVEKGLTTWKELEAMGKALAPHSKARSGVWSWVI